MRIFLSMILFVFVITPACVPNDDGGTPGLSEAQLNQAIADHAAQASAHHTKTTDAGELVSGTLDAARLPTITVDTSAVTSSGQDGSVFPHNCAWRRTDNNSNDAFVIATCPAGQHPISGSCTSNDLAIAVVSSQPVQGASILTDGDLVTDADGWSCIFGGASMNHIARVLCCNY